MIILNLTPHPMHIYPLDTPDRIAPENAHPIAVIPPSAEHPRARLGHTVVPGSATVLDGVPVEEVVFGADTSDPHWLPDPVPGTRYVVSLVVGLAADHRDDLLVPHDYVRDLNGAVIGSRKLARPVHPAGHSDLINAQPMNSPAPLAGTPR
jgi:hypothetical protein